MSFGYNDMLKNLKGQLSQLLCIDRMNDIQANLF